MRWMLLLAVALSSACYWRRYEPVVSRDAVEDLEDAASDSLQCDEIEVRRLTLLTRLVEGCGNQRVYAWDPLREQWVLASVEDRQR